MMSTTKTFRYDDVIYTQEKTGYCYGQPVGGIKKRISKNTFEEAYNNYVNGEVSDEIWQAQADLEKEQQEIARQAQYEADERAVLGEEINMEEEIANEAKVLEDHINKKAKKAAKPRKSKDIAYSHKFGTETLTLTAKQVDFIRHIKDTCFYEDGVDSIVYCDVLADEIGGQFEGKPMTVGAMISTLREKGLVDITVDRINGKKVKCMSFTPSGKDVARALGLN